MYGRPTLIAAFDCPRLCRRKLARPRIPAQNAVQHAARLAICVHLIFHKHMIDGFALAYAVQVLQHAAHAPSPVHCRCLLELFPRDCVVYVQVLHAHPLPMHQGQRRRGLVHTLSHPPANLQMLGLKLGDIIDCQDTDAQRFICTVKAKNAHVLYSWIFIFLAPLI